MAEQVYSEEPVVARPQAAVPPSTVVVTDRPRSSGVGWIAAIVILLAILVAIWAFIGIGQGNRDSDLAKDNALTQAADKVGNAADKVGAAAGKVGSSVESGAKSAADKASDTAVTVTTGSSQAPADNSSGD